jgi:hypothetical protein
MRNPFKTLGLNPEVLRGLSDDQIKQLVKTMFRQLQLIFHPDMEKGNDKRSTELNEVYSQIGPDSDPKDFLFYKQEFFKRTPAHEKITNLEDEIMSLQGMINSMDLVSYERFWEFFSIATGLENQGPNVFNLRDVTLRMVDYIRGQNQFVGESMCKKDTFFEMIFDDKGVITRREGKNKFQLPNKRVIGTISESESRLNGSIGQIIKKMTGQNFATLYESDLHDPNKQMPQNGAFKRIVSRGVAETEEMVNYINFNSFFGICRMISPIIQKGSYLFAANKSGGEIYFTLEGKILEIENHNPA